MTPALGKILFFVALVFGLVALYATIAFAVTGQVKFALIWGALLTGAVIGSRSYWRTWHQARTR